MKTINHFQVNSIAVATIICFIVSCTRGGSMQSTDDSRLVESSTKSSDYNKVENITDISGCKLVEYELKDLFLLENNDLFLETKNMTIHSSEYQKKDGKILICLPSGHGIDNRLILNCKDKFEYEKDEFYILPNNSAMVGNELVPEGEYELRGDILLACAPDDDGDGVSTGLTLQKFSIYVGQAGSGISIIALIMHLSTFVLLPSLRNLPGYNLASLSVSFLLAYSFVLIGQIPQVLGLFCVISGILQQNFFLVAFFCMNVLAFDVWRTLKLATEKLIVGSQNTRNRQFIWYSLYAWGIPLIITSISVIVDNVKSIPNNIKPDYGKDDVCWMGNKLSKAIFFAAPAFTLFTINAIFFTVSSWMISSNTMKCSKDQNKQAVKLNYILYVRLALMMGLTWLIGLIAFASKSEVIWFIFDLFNSLQGLFLFLLFTCTKKVFKQLVQKTSSIVLSSVKQTTVASSSSTVSSKV